MSINSMANILNNDTKGYETSKVDILEKTTNIENIVEHTTSTTFGIPYKSCCIDISGYNIELLSSL